MLRFTNWLVWLFIIGAIVSGLLSLYLLNFGQSYDAPTHWRYYPDRCSLLCDDRECIHPMRFPKLHAQLVRPQIILLKQTGSYKMANLLVYFALVPSLYAVWLVSVTRRLRRKTPVGFTVLLFGIATLLLGYMLSALSTSRGQLQLYWGATEWCVVQTNRLHTSLFDFYTILFGLAIPVSVVGILGWFLVRRGQTLLRRQKLAGAD